MTTTTGVILYGPPAAGRRRITAALCSGRSRFFDASGQSSAPPGRSIPVRRLDSVADVTATSTDTTRWLRVLLWLPQSAVRSRTAEHEIDGRLLRWEAAYADLVAHPEMTWAVALRTDTVEPARAAEIIADAASQPRQPATRTVLLHRFLFR